MSSGVPNKGEAILEGSSVVKESGVGQDRVELAHGVVERSLGK